MAGGLTNGTKIWHWRRPSNVTSGAEALGVFEVANTASLQGARVCAVAVNYSPLCHDKNISIKM